MCETVRGKCILKLTFLHINSNNIGNNFWFLSVNYVHLANTYWQLYRYGLFILPLTINCRHKTKLPYQNRACVVFNNSDVPAVIFCLLLILKVKLKINCIFCFVFCGECGVTINFIQEFGTRLIVWKFLRTVEFDLQQVLIKKMREHLLHILTVTIKLRITLLLL